MRKFVFLLVVLCVFAFSSDASAQCNGCAVGPVRKVIRARPAQRAVFGASRLVANVVRVKPVRNVARSALRVVGKTTNGVGRAIVRRSRSTRHNCR